MTSPDERFMQRALELAARGANRTAPNPLVGAVVVRGGKIVGEGYHRAYGGPHAEVHAIRAAGAKAKGATVYISLEPCSPHPKKTPPCTDLLVRSGIARAVVAIKDPNPLVHGRGLALLRRAGIKVASATHSTISWTTGVARSLDAWRAISRRAPSIPSTSPLCPSSPGRGARKPVISRRSA